MDMFDLEKHLPDELIADGSWGHLDSMDTGKPPAQGPGPGNLQNGIESNDGSVALRQQMHHMLQQVLYSLACDTFYN